MPRVRKTLRPPSEHDIQAALFGWIGLKSETIPELACAYAVPNGARTSMKQAVKLKAEGLKAGVPDVVLAVAQPRGHGSLYIEMKTPKTYPEPHQKEWADRLEANGMKVIRRCTSWQDAARHMLEYLGHEVTRRKYPELFVD